MIDYEKRITVVKGDATKSDDINKILNQVDVIIHCVSVPLKHEKPTHLYSETTQAIIDARPDGTAKQLIVMSSTGTHHGRKLPRPANLIYEKML
jgi:putative NADH-flavin reductase